MNVFMELIEADTSRKVTINLDNVISYESFLSDTNWTMVRFNDRRDDRAIFKIDEESFARALEALGYKIAKIIEPDYSEWPDPQGMTENLA